MYNCGHEIDPILSLFIAYEIERGYLQAKLTAISMIKHCFLTPYHC